MSVSSNKLRYIPNKNPAKSILQIDGKDVSSPPPIHPITTSKPSGVTPRIMLDPSFRKMLQPTEIDPSRGDIQLLEWRGSDCKNVVVFAHENSTDSLVRRLYEVYRNKKDELKQAIRRAPREAFQKDDLAGGEYLAVGYASIPPGPDGCPKHWRGPSGRKHQIPYIRQTIRHPEVQTLTKIAACMQAAAADLLCKYFPGIYNDNQKMMLEAEDVMFPPVKLQKRASASGNNCFFSNQFIWRLIGHEAPGTTLPLLHSLLALHTDESDEPAWQAFQFWPMGGIDGKGGFIDGTNLMVFGNEEGGECASIPTTIPGYVVLVVMNGCKQLHGGDGGKGRDDSDFGSVPAWSARFIPYIRGPIMRMIEHRRQCEKGPKAFTDLHQKKRENTCHWIRNRFNTGKL